MSAQIVGKDNVAWLQFRPEALVEVNKKGFLVDRSLQLHRGLEPVFAQRPDERQRFGRVPRQPLLDSLARRSPAIAARHVDVGSSLVDKDEALPCPVLNLSPESLLFLFIRLGRQDRLFFSSAGSEL